MKFNKTHTFAFWSSAAIVFFLAFFLYLIPSLLGQTLTLNVLLITCISLFIFSFIFILLRVKVFIYNHVKKIYDDVTLPDIDDVKKDSNTNNMESLSEEMKRFAEKKQIEIASLNEREAYRREFLGNVSHELKTPLFTVQGYLLTLIDGAGNSKPIREKYLQRANKGVERLVSVVKDLDMISKLESDELGLSIQQFNIIELIQDVFDLLEMRAKKKNITLFFNKEYDVPILVNGDIERIEQVLINLIMNSIKYGKINGSTIVSVESYLQDKILIKISDNGEGIHQEHLPRLFERFYRVDQSRSREQGGSGLGLSIVKHIIEAHDETILASSVYGEGSEFSFTLKKVK